MPTSFRFRVVLAALAAILLVPVAGCDLISKDSDEAVEGVWLLRGDDVIFLVVSTDRITDYEFSGDCYDISVTNIIERDGDQWTIAPALLPDLQFVATVRQDGDTLTFSLLGETEVLDRSDRTVASFAPECGVGSKGNSESWIHRMQRSE